tara:strand:+ start:551 stop:757 length:207 start_codon:yes stop_codon:yes gene_type:complete
MSLERKNLTSKYLKDNSQLSSNFNQKKVNVTDLIGKLKNQDKRDKRNNIILSITAILAVTFFGIILTL